MTMRLLLRTHGLRLRRPGGEGAKFLNWGYPHFRDEERTKITHGQPRISKALRFSARFLNFFFTRPELPRPLFPGPGLLRDSRRRTRYALRAAQWQSGGCCKTRVRRYPKPPVAATNQSSLACNAGGHIMLPGHLRGILPTF